jgi:hypothetical protein
MAAVALAAVLTYFGSEAARFGARWLAWHRLSAANPNAKLDLDLNGSASGTFIEPDGRVVQGGVIMISRGKVGAID